MSNSLTRWNPMRELANVQSMMDRLFEDWRPFNEDFGRATGNLLAMDVDEDDQQYTVTTELPGVQSENIKVRQDGDYLLIEGDIPDQTVEREGKRSLIKERRYGRFSRRVRLPQNVDFDKADATYDNGVLTLTLPKAKEVITRSIPVKVGGAK